MAIQTYTSGQILTAASMTALQFQAVMTFTNEAARDAAITAPTEGMFAYLTAPTVPTSTTGALTAYTGSSWACLTPQGAVVNTLESTSSTSYTALATAGPAVTLVTGTKALVTITATIDSASTAGNTQVYAAFAVSGATTIASNDDQALDHRIGGSFATLSGTYLVSGLTAGTNTFTMQYKTGNASDAGRYQRRNIVVVGVL
jgi:hypothetical protein